MIYSHQSSILWRPKAALSQMSRMWAKCGRGREGKLGGLRTPIMGEIGCWYWRMMTTVKFQRKNAQRCTWRKVNADRVIMAAVLLWWCEGGFWKRQEHWWWDLWYEEVEAKDEIKELEVSVETPRGWAETNEKIVAKFFMQGQRKNHCTKNKLNLLGKNSIGKYDIIITYKMHLQQT